jgi:hypothetical protein
MLGWARLFSDLGIRKTAKFQEREIPGSGDEEEIG